jgi:hypothetical protein
MGNLKSAIKILRPSRIYSSLDRLKSLRIGPVAKAMPPIRSLAQLVPFAVLFPAAILVTIATVAFQTVLSASIPDDAPAAAPATTGSGQTGTRFASLSKDVRVAQKSENSRNISISLNGENPLKVECGETFSDPGATAINGAGKTVPVQVSGNVDTATLGTYTLTYTAVDDKDTASVERTVTVIDTTPPVSYTHSEPTRPY